MLSFFTKSDSLKNAAIGPSLPILENSYIPTNFGYYIFDAGLDMNYSYQLNFCFTEMNHKYGLTWIAIFFNKKMSFDLYTIFIEDNKLLSIIEALDGGIKSGIPIHLDHENNWKLIEYAEKHIHRILNIHGISLKGRGYFFINDRKTKHLIAKETNLYI